MNSEQHEFLNVQLDEDLMDILMDRESGRTTVSETADRINRRVEAAYDLGKANYAALVDAAQSAQWELESWANWAQAQTDLHLNWENAVEIADRISKLLPAAQPQASAEE